MLNFSVRLFHSKSICGGREGSDNRYMALYGVLVRND